MFLAFLAAQAAPFHVERHQPIETKFERMAPAAVNLGNKIALVGGYSYTDRKTLPTISYFLNAKNEIDFGPGLREGRNHFAAFGPDDHTLVAIGGFNHEKGSLASVESYDFRTWKKTRWPELAFPTELFSTYQQGDKVFVVGGLTSQTPATHAEIQVVDLKTHAVQPWGSLATSRFGQGSCLVSSKRAVLVAGGKTVESHDGKAVYKPIDSIELFSIDAPRIEDGGHMTIARDRPAVVSVDDHRALIIGGANDGGTTDTVELYDATTKESKVVAHLITPRMAAAALPYQGKGVFVVGGWCPNPELGRQIEYIDFADFKVKTVGYALSCRAEAAALWLNPTTFGLYGGKDMFKGRDPHSYAFKQAEIFEVVPG